MISQTCSKGHSLLAPLVLGNVLLDFMASWEGGRCHVNSRVGLRARGGTGGRVEVEGRLVRNEGWPCEAWGSGKHGGPIQTGPKGRPQVPECGPWKSPTCWLLPHPAGSRGWGGGVVTSLCGTDKAGWDI